MDWLGDAFNCYRQAVTVPSLIGLTVALIVLLASYIFWAAGRFLQSAGRGEPFSDNNGR